MSLSQRLHEVTFNETLHGYNPGEVDAFLAETAASVDQLLAHIQALEAAAANPAAYQNLGEGTVARALLLAQRAADTAIAEAEESARITKDQAEAEAGRIVRQARVDAAAVTEAARSAAETSMIDLEQRRDPLVQGLAGLHARAVQCRDGLREMLSDQLLALDGWLAAASVEDTVAPSITLDPPSVQQARPPWAEEPMVDLTVARPQPVGANQVTIPPPSQAN